MWPSLNGLFLSPPPNSQMMLAILQNDQLMTSGQKMAVD